MNMVGYELSKDEGKAYRTFNWLLKHTKNVNLETLKQISVYLARSNDEFNIFRVGKINFNSNSSCYELLLSNGVKIVFSAGDIFGFTVSRIDDNILMSVVVSEREKGNLSTANIYGKIRIKDDGMYIVTFRPNDIYDKSLKYGTINYYTEDEINWFKEIVDENPEVDFDIIARKNFIYPFAEKSFFESSSQTDIDLDCFNGCLTTTMNMVHLLYENVKTIKVNKLVRKK